MAGREAVTITTMYMWQLKQLLLSMSDCNWALRAAEWATLCSTSIKKKEEGGWEQHKRLKLIMDVYGS